MKCPIDNSSLKPKEYERAVMVDQCGTCSGMWLDQWELRAIQANKGKNYSEEIKQLPELVNSSYLQALEKNRPALNCPKCSAQMDRYEHGYCSQILIDVCHDCQGVWLDNGEIQALEVFFERSHIDDKEIKTGFLHSLWFMLNKNL
jgi:Zn-finger nucleic acid-binding protein